MTLIRCEWNQLACELNEWLVFGRELEKIKST